jgi:hypothetical protein
MTEIFASPSALSSMTRLETKSCSVPGRQRMPVGEISPEKKGVALPSASTWKMVPPWVAT